MSKRVDLMPQMEAYAGSLPVLGCETVANGTKSKAVSATGGLSALDSVIREESLKLVQRLFLSAGQSIPKTVMFAAIDSDNGCSSLCAVIGGFLAESVSGSVCLVDGNFRAPALATALGVQNHYGFADALRQEGAIKSFAKQIGPNNLWLLSSGSLPQDSLDLLNGGRLKERLSELRAEFDYLLIEAPPLSRYADGVILSRLVDGVVLILEASGTRREAALRVTESLRTSNIPILGAVLNNRTFPIPDALYKRL
jgi:Mrp family chromosome partitioning ATPase